MSFDVGAKRTGIAVTDDAQIIASPLKTVEIAVLHDFIKKYCAQHKVSGFVVGLPKNLDNTPAESAHLAENLVGFLKNHFPGTPVHSVDERFTSKMAVATMVSMGVKKEKRMDKASVDEISAALILQTFLAMRDAPH